MPSSWARASFNEAIHGHTEPGRTGIAASQTFTESSSARWTLAAFERVPNCSLQGSYLATGYAHAAADVRFVTATSPLYNSFGHAYLVAFSWTLFNACVRKDQQGDDQTLRSDDTLPLAFLAAPLF